VDRTIDLTEEQLHAAFATALGFDDLAEDGPDCKTLDQLAVEFRCSRNSAEGRAKKAESRGEMERVKVRRATANGRVWILVAYRLTAK
jgi:hypothetical protein